MPRTNNLLPGIVECVLCCTTVEMVNGSSKGKDRKNVTKCKKTKHKCDNIQKDKIQK